MLETSNPNRSVLINKSLIHSRKHISEEDLSGEFSFDQIPQEALNESLLGSIRSNLLETGEPGISDNSTRRDRSNNLSLDMNKGIINLETRMPTLDHEHIKAGSSRSHEPKQTAHGASKAAKVDLAGLMKRPKSKFDMRLDLSAIMRANALGLEGLSYADVQKLDTKKLENGHHIKMEFPVPQFSSTVRSHSKPEKSKFKIPIPSADNDKANTESVKFSANQTLNSFVNQLDGGPFSSYRITFPNESLSLNEAYEGLRKVGFL